MVPKKWCNNFVEGFVILLHDGVKGDHVNREEKGKISLSCALIVCCGKHSQPRDGCTHR